MKIRMFISFFHHLLFLVWDLFQAVLALSIGLGSFSTMIPWSKCLKVCYRNKCWPSKYFLLTITFFSTLLSLDLFFIKVAYWTPVQSTYIPALSFLQCVFFFFYRLDWHPSILHIPTLTFFFLFSFFAFVYLFFISTILLQYAGNYIHICIIQPLCLYQKPWFKVPICIYGLMDLMHYWLYRWDPSEAHHQIPPHRCCSNVGVVLFVCLLEWRR